VIYLAMALPSLDEFLSAFDGFHRELFGEAGEFASGAGTLMSLTPPILQLGRQVNTEANSCADWPFHLEKRLFQEGWRGALYQFDNVIVSNLSLALQQPAETARATLMSLRTAANQLREQFAQLSADFRIPPADSHHEGPIETDFERAFVQVDMVDYSIHVENLRRYCRNFTDELNNVDGFNTRIRVLISDSLPRPLQVDHSILVTTGDGAILSMPAIGDAHRFAAKLHDTCAVLDFERGRSLMVAPVPNISVFQFRVGVSWGWVQFRDLRRVRPNPFRGNDLSGIPLIEAARMESGANPGETILTDKAYRRLQADDSDLSEQYHGPFEIRVKHGHRLPGYRTQRPVEAPPDAPPPLNLPPSPQDSKGVPIPVVLLLLVVEAILLVLLLK